MKYVIVRSSRFERSLKRVSRYPSFKREEFEVVLDLLLKDTPLSARFRDHELKGEQKGIRECHIRGDLLLLYKKEKDILVLLLLVDIGTHSDLFDK